MKNILSLVILITNMRGKCENINIHIEKNDIIFFSGTPYGLSYDIYENYYDYELSDNDIESDIITPQFISQPLNMVSIVQGIRQGAN